MNERFLKLISYLPWVVILNNFFCIFYGYLCFGHVPQYSLDPKPHTIGLDPFVFIELLLGIFTGVGTIVYVLALIILKNSRGKSYRINFRTMLRLGLGLGLLRCMSIVFGTAVAWFFD